MIEYWLEVGLALVVLGVIIYLIAMGTASRRDFVDETLEDEIMAGKRQRQAETGMGSVPGNNVVNTNMGDRSGANAKQVSSSQESMRNSPNGTNRKEFDERD